VQSEETKSTQFDTHFGSCVSSLLSLLSDEDLRRMFRFLCFDLLDFCNDIMQCAQRLL